MREIGGYIELDRYTGSMLHGDGIRLNSGRNALEYLIMAKNIRKLYMPVFMCDSCEEVLEKCGTEVVYYHIGSDFRPMIGIWDGWLYLVNFYGQLSNEYIASLGTHVIVDNAQAYFQDPVSGRDTIYTCRKFFGVADGAILYTDQRIEIEEQDQSFDRMHFLLGRFERPANEFYQEYVNNNHMFSKRPVRKMSALTENLLHGIDYEMVRKKRTENFAYLHEQLKSRNRLKLSVPEGAFMYPFYVEGGSGLRKKLQAKRIYIPLLWPAVLKRCGEDETEYDMAQNILPLPVDQRYDIEDMKYMADHILLLT